MYSFGEIITIMLFMPVTIWKMDSSLISMEKHFSIRGKLLPWIIFTRPGGVKEWKDIESKYSNT